MERDKRRMRHLAGTWYSELGARIELVVHPDGRLNGTYSSAVGDASGTFEIIGVTDDETYQGNRCFGLVVLWRNSLCNLHSVTVWSGQYQIIDGQEVLTTTWLLTKETVPKHDWLSTMVGTDVFYRTPPKETIKHKALAHPEMPQP